MTSTEVFSHAAVAAPHRLATIAGRDVLAQGGNAVEAMVAMAAVIAVVYPHMNGIGGDGFWLLREPKGRVRALDASGAAGSLATIERYRKAGFEKIPARGPMAALTVPGAVGGWALALEYAAAIGGRLALRDLLAPAIGHASRGYPISGSELRSHPDRAELMDGPGFSDPYLVDGEWPKAGATRRHEKLAGTLDHLASVGLADFYRGDVAREIASDFERLGCPMTRVDLEKYTARLREPLSLSLPGRTLYNFPPPTQGLASLLILGIYEELGIKQVDSFEHVHALVEATKRAFALRERYCIDPNFTELEPEDVLDRRAIGREASLIAMDRAATYPLAEAKGDTIWMGCIDNNGLAVSYIQSIYWEYGSGCVLPCTGILMQNRGVSFQLEGGPNPLRPGRKPFHTLNPALATFADGRVMPYGTMGGDGQPQIQAQVMTRYHAGMGLAEAIDAPRFIYGRTWGTTSGLLYLEDRFDPSILRALERAGHELSIHPQPYADGFGHAGALVRNARGRIEAAHDPRADGGADGL